MLEFTQSVVTVSHNSKIDTHLAESILLFAIELYINFVKSTI